MIVYYILSIFVIGFGLVVFVGAPYVPIFQRDIVRLFDKGKIKKGDRLVELGCGDGRVLIEAARRGVHADGWELNPVLFLVAYLRTIRYRALVRVHWGDFWRVDLEPYDYAFTFLITKFMPRLEQKLKDTKSAPILLSYIYELPNTKPSTKTGNGYIYRFDETTQIR